MFENRSQESKTEVNSRNKRSQNSSHEQTCFSYKKKPVESHYSSSSRKNQKKAKSSPSYRCAAINKRTDDELLLLCFVNRIWNSYLQLTLKYEWFFRYKDFWNDNFMRENLKHNYNNQISISSNRIFQTTLFFQNLARWSFFYQKLEPF